MTPTQWWQAKLDQWRAPHGLPGALAAGADRPLLPAALKVDAAWGARHRDLLRHPWQPDVSLQLPEGIEGSSAPSEPTLAGWSATWRASAADRGLSGLHPADGRYCDHPASSHRRMAAALAFATDDHPERAPVLLRVSLHGVQRFISEARKLRDLWTGCMVFGELVWAAMAPIVEHYGPDALVYPDLRGNPLADQWLLQRGYGADSIPPTVRAAGAPTAAVPVPNTFVALVPRGPDAEAPKNHLLPLSALMERVNASVGARWAALRQAVREFVQHKVGRGRWESVFDSTLAEAPEVSWGAIRWTVDQVDAGRVPDGPVLIGRRESDDGPPRPKAFAAREASLEPWIPPEVWAHHQHARRVFWASAPPGAQAWGGFDYGLRHHQLWATHELHTLRRPQRAMAQAGDKCTISGRHEALSNQPVEPQTVVGLGGQRRAVEAFWKAMDLKDDTGEISERLGAPCTVKRYLAKCADEGGLLTRWNGVGQSMPDRDDRTAPFPSTAALAAARFLEYLGTACSDPDVAQAVQRWAAAHEKAKAAANLDDDTQHRRALPRLAPFFGQSTALDTLFRTEADTLSLPVLGVIKARLGDDAQPVDALIKTTGALLQTARRCEIEVADERWRRPGTEYAVLAMDIDGMSRLLLGDPAVVQTRWRDVLHPECVAALEAQGRDDPKVAPTHWRGLLEARRVVGPSLHATLTRSLAALVDGIIPWVIEAEFAGRLVYAGGDDLLALLPAGEALAAAARIQQLASAPFVVDTRPDSRPWSGRRGLSRDELRDAPWRFRVPQRTGSDPTVLGAATWEAPVTLLAKGPAAPAAPPPEQAQVLPMLGRAHGLSAGIAFAHFKTPLGRVLSEARSNLEVHAKGHSRARVKEGLPLDGHVSISRLARGGGVKARFTAPWRLTAEVEGAGRTKHEGPIVLDGPPDVWTHVRGWRDAFLDNRLAARLPYGLRRTLASLTGALLEAGDGAVTLIDRAVQQDTPSATGEDRTSVSQGLRSEWLRWRSVLHEVDVRAPDAPGAGLLIARHLARGGDDEA